MAKGCIKYLPGKMDKRVALQSVSSTPDGQGGYDESWATDATVWAYLRPLKGYERLQAAQAQTPVTHRITIRHRAGVSTRTRVLYGTRVFDVTEVINPDEADQFLEIQAIEQQ